MMSPSLSTLVFSLPEWIDSFTEGEIGSLIEGETILPQKGILFRQKSIPFFSLFLPFVAVYIKSGPSQKCGKIVGFVPYFPKKLYFCNQN